MTVGTRYLEEYRQREDRCKATTAAGKNCPNPMNGDGYCHLHGNPADRCSATTLAGLRCRRKATKDGLCPIHAAPKRKWWGHRQPIERLHLVDRVEELRREGYCYNTIANQLGISASTVSVYAWERLGLGSHLGGKQNPHPGTKVSAVHLAEQERQRHEAEEREREEWRREVRRMVAAGVDLPWRRSPEPEPTEEVIELARAQEAESERERREAQFRAFSWDDPRGAYTRPRFVESLDAPLKSRRKGLAGYTPSRYATHDDPDGRDPFLVLTDATEENMQTILGDIDIEDVDAMGEESRARLRQRVIEAGLPLPSVQQAERDRLREPEPHHGSAPAPKKGRKAPRHRGRNEASALHRSRGKRFVRRNDKKARDGWGSVVLLDEIPSRRSR